MAYPLTNPLKPKPIAQPLGNSKPAIAQPDPLQAQHQKLRADFDAAGQRATTFRNQQAAIAIPAPIIKEGRMSVSSVANPATDAAVSARRTLGERAAAEDATRNSMIPAFQNLTTAFREQAAKNRAVATAGDANRVLSGVGAAPVPQLARPDFGNVSTGFSTRQAPTIRTPSQLEQASRDEVTARHEAKGPGATGGVIAVPTGASGYYIGGNGVRREINADGSIAGSTHTPAPIARPNLGATAERAPESGFRPQVPSTYGISVLDPRMDDQQTPIARPTGSFRGPDAMSEQYRSREAQEAVTKMVSSIDSEIFARSLAAQRGEPAAIKAISDLTEQKAGLLSGQARLSDDAIQGREGRDNRLQVTGLEQQGQDRRTDAQIRLGDRNATNAFDMAAMEDSTKREAIAAEIARPQFTTDAQGRYVSVSGTSARPVLDENGNPMIARPDRADGAITPALRYEQAGNELKALLNNPPIRADDPDYAQQVKAARATLAALAASGQATPAPEAVQHLQANPQLAADFDLKYGEGASTRYLKVSSNQPKTAVNPKTGERVQFNPKTNTWEPLR